jgi:hypothetical protein
MHLTPAPLHLLVALSRGAVLHEVLKDSWFALERPGWRGFQRIHARGVNVLKKLSLIEQADHLVWHASSAGRAWLAANGIVAELEKLS